MKRVTPCRCLDGHVKEPYEMSIALGARPYVQLLLQSACTSMYRHKYNLKIVACDVKQPISLTFLMNLVRLPYSVTSIPHSSYTHCTTPHVKAA